MGPWPASLKGPATLAPEIIKVCGITNVDDAQFAAENGATALGMIFYPGSPRFVDAETAARISRAVPEDIVRVGVFVNEAPEKVLEIAALAGLDVAQLHGDESPEVCAGVSPLRVWKVLRVGEDFEPADAAVFTCEAFFLDTAGDGLYGGTGQTFPWQRAAEVKRYGRVIVAGGLDANNVGQAIRLAQPFGVDSSSKLERSPGVKDHDKVRRYLEAAKDAARKATLEAAQEATRAEVK